MTFRVKARQACSTKILQIFIWAPSVASFTALESLKSTAIVNDNEISNEEDDKLCCSVYYISTGFQPSENSLMQSSLKTCPQS